MADESWETKLAHGDYEKDSKGMILRGPASEISFVLHPCTSATKTGCSQNS